LNWGEFEVRAFGLRSFEMKKKVVRMTIGKKKSLRKKVVMMKETGVGRRKGIARKREIRVTLFEKIMECVKHHHASEREGEVMAQMEDSHSGDGN